MKRFRLPTQSVYYILAVALTCSVWGCKEDPVEPENQSPTALFTATPTAATVGEPISFSDASGDNDGTIQRWDWDFGDGNTSMEQNPTHEYETAGTFEVSLTVTDDDGGYCQLHSFCLH